MGPEKEEVFVFSGGGSVDFWKDVNSIDANSTGDDFHNMFYAIGCALQELEGNFDKRLKRLEDKVLSREQKAQMECDHTWVSANNEVVTNGEICMKCLSIRAVPDWMPKKGEWMLVWDLNEENAIGVQFGSYDKDATSPWRGQGSVCRWKHAKPFPLQVRCNRYKKGLEAAIFDLVNKPAHITEMNMKKALEDT